MRQPKCECGECKYCKKRSEYLRHRARYIERSVEYQKVNRLQTNVKNARWKKQHPDKVLAQQKRRRQRHKESGSLIIARVSIEWFDTKLTEQGGGCAICGKVARKGERNLHIDHDHNTGANRGILCPRCNTCLPVIENDSEWADKAVAYLRKYEAQWQAEMAVRYGQKV